MFIITLLENLLNRYSYVANLLRQLIFSFGRSRHPGYQTGPEPKKDYQKQQKNLQEKQMKAPLVFIEMKKFQLY